MLFIQSRVFLPVTDQQNTHFIFRSKGFALGLFNLLNAEASIEDEILMYIYYSRERVERKTMHVIRMKYSQNAHNIAVYDNDLNNIIIHAKIRTAGLH